jgi:hypothetical protein
LPAPGGPDQQQVVPASRGDLERALGDLHAFDVAQVRGAPGLGQPSRVGRGENLVAAKMVDERQQVGRGQHLDPPRPGRLAALTGGADEAKVARRRADRRRQHTRDRVQRTVEVQLPKRRVALHLIARQHVHRREHGERDRQVVVAALLQQVGGREIDEQAARRQGQAHRRERRAHPLPRLPHRLVGQADDEEGGQPGGDLHLHLDRHRLDAREGEGSDTGDGSGSGQGVHAQDGSGSAPRRSA